MDRVLGEGGEKAVGVPVGDPRRLPQQRQRMPRDAEVRGRGDAEVTTSARQADELLRKVELLSALTDSNRVLREEKTSLSLELSRVRSGLCRVRSELSCVEETVVIPLRSSLSSLESRVEHFDVENSSLREEVSRWRSRANELIEKTREVNPEQEMKRLASEVETLTRTLSVKEEILKRKEVELGRLSGHLKLVQGQVGSLKGANQGLGRDKERLEVELDAAKAKCERVRGVLRKVEEDARGVKLEAERLRGEVQKLEGLLEEQKATVKQANNIARKYKKQFEDLQQLQQQQQEQAAAEEAAASAALLGEAEEKISGLESQLEEKERAVETLLRSLLFEAERSSVEEKASLVRSLEESLEEKRNECEMLKQRVASLIEKKMKITSGGGGVKRVRRRRRRGVSSSSSDGGGEASSSGSGVPAAADAKRMRTTTTAPATKNNKADFVDVDNKPSRVVHIRNTPSVVSETEIAHLGTPFGRVSNVLVLKGKKQALVELESESAAAAMVRYFNTVFLQLRGRTILVKFSRHKELQLDDDGITSSSSAAAAAAERNHHHHKHKKHDRDHRHRHRDRDRPKHRRSSSSSSSSSKNKTTKQHSSADVKVKAKDYRFD